MMGNTPFSPSQSVLPKELASMYGNTSAAAYKVLSVYISLHALSASLVHCFLIELLAFLCLLSFL